MIQREQVDATSAIVQRGGGIPVVVVGTAVLARLLAGGVQRRFLAQPVVFIVSGVHIGGSIAVVVGREHQVEALQQQVSFAVFRRWRLVPAALLLIGLNMLRGNPDMVNFQLHHNTECIAFLLVLCVTALSERGSTVSDRLCFAGIRMPLGRRKRRALLGGVMVSTLFCFWFFAQSVVGAADLRGRLAPFPDAAGVFEEIKAQNHGAEEHNNVVEKNTAIEEPADETESSEQ